MINRPFGEMGGFLRRSILRELLAGTVVLAFIDCDKPPLRGPQSEYLRLCRRIVISIQLLLIFLRGKKYKGST
jgi:hypothetical protein